MLHQRRVEATLFNNKQSVQLDNYQQQNQSYQLDFHKKYCILLCPTTLGQHMQALCRFILNCKQYT